jgi:DNA-directed RNA polymerase sigma subunit (sigma70/sigma32)
MGLDCVENPRCVCDKTKQEEAMTSKPKVKLNRNRKPARKGVGELFGVTRERDRQIEARLQQRLGRSFADLRQDL